MQNIALSYIVVIIALLFYLNYALKRPKYYFEVLVRLLRVLLILFYWVFFMPFYESFISIFKCYDGKHYLL